MSIWPSVPLPEIADLCLGKMLDKKKNKGTLRPYLANINVRWGTLDLEDLREMPFEDRELVRYGLEAGDIVMCEGGEPGRCVLWTDQVPGMMLQKALHRIRPNDTVDSRFLYYSLFCKGRTGGLDPYFTGATIKHLPGEQLAKVCVSLPPLEIQRRIASILGAYDDLIEVNRHRVAVLEEMARGLFEEWFVRFRFPGHKSVPIVELPDGPLPQGWELKAVEEVTSFINRGIAPKYSDDSETLVVNQKCIRDGRVNLALARRQTKTPPVAKLVRVGDVLINSTGVGTLGRVAQAEEIPKGLTVDSHVTIVRPERREDRDYLGLLLLSLQSTFENLGAGSTGQTELSRQAIGAQVVSWAPPGLRTSFGAIVRPMRALVAELMKQNEHLAASRDLLLPRLISGQLSVEAAERDLEQAA